MTPAQLTTTMRAIFGEYKPSISSSELHQVLARVLGHEITCAQCGKPHPTWCCCPTCGPSSGGTIIVPDKPSAPLREPATMVAKDRAAEMAEERVFLDVNIVTLRDEGGKFAVTIWEPEHAADILKDVREWFADALRAYGDELLEKIASEMFGQSVCGNAEFAALDRWQAFVRSYKSSAAKGGIAS